MRWEGAAIFCGEKKFLSGSSCQGYLPTKGNWYLGVKAVPSDANYSLYLEFPERLNFPEGIYEKSAIATVPAAGVHNFIIWAEAGQTSVLTSSSQKILF